MQSWWRRAGLRDADKQERLSVNNCGLKARQHHLPSSPEKTQTAAFQMGLPALDLFPRDVWARVMGRRLRTQTRFDLAVGDVCGERVLRQAIVDYLRVSRSIECQPEQVLLLQVTQHQ